MGVPLQLQFQIQAPAPFRDWGGGGASYPSHEPPRLRGLAGVLAISPFRGKIRGDRAQARVEVSTQSLNGGFSRLRWAGRAARSLAFPAIPLFASLAFVVHFPSYSPSNSKGERRLSLTSIPIPSASYAIGPPLLLVLVDRFRKGGEVGRGLSEASSARSARGSSPRKVRRSGELERAWGSIALPGSKPGSVRFEQSVARPSGARAPRYPFILAEGGGGGKGLLRSGGGGDEEQDPLLGVGAA